MNQQQMNIEISVRGLCRRIREARLNKGAEIEPLARASGVASNRIVAFESIAEGGPLDTKTSSHRRAPTAVEILQLADALGVSAAALMGSVKPSCGSHPMESEPDFDSPATGFNSLEEFRDFSPDAPSDSRFWRTHGQRWASMKTEDDKRAFVDDFCRWTGFDVSTAISRMREELKFSTK